MQYCDADFILGPDFQPTLTAAGTITAELGPALVACGETLICAVSRLFGPTTMKADGVWVQTMEKYRSSLQAMVSKLEDIDYDHC